MEKKTAARNTATRRKKTAARKPTEEHERGRERGRTLQTKRKKAKKGIKMLGAWTRKERGRRKVFFKIY